MDIKQYVNNKKEELKNYIATLNPVPGFVVIQVNEDEASNAYVKGKLKDAIDLGINAKLVKLPLDISQENLINEIEKINNDSSIHGLIVQMPLPKHIDEEAIKLAVSPSKDIDGFHPMSEIDPCTPKGIINFLQDNNFSFVGQNALVIGRSNIVGKPMAKLLLDRSCNVIQVHSKTKPEDFNYYLENADLIVIAIGKKHYLNESYKYKKDAIIIDVGINRIDGKLYGDAKNDLSVKYKSPVPGGVGLLTRLTLLTNLLETYKKITNKY